MKYSFFNNVNGTIYFVGNLMEIYIPSNYFDIKLASYEGDMIKTLGVFEFVVYPDENNRSTKSGSRHLLKLPMNMSFQYRDSFNAKNILGKNEDSYKVFVLKKGDIFLDSSEKEKDSNNTKDFIFKLHSGKIPKNIPYNDIIKIYLDSLNLNSVNLENPSCIFEVSIAELYRDKNNEEIPFRRAINKNPNLTMLDYQPINIKELPGIKGTFQAMMFENMRQSIQYSILKTKTNGNETETPLEKIARY